jgi:hypothetical protein
MLAVRVELRRWAAKRSGQQSRGCDVDSLKKQLEPCFLMMRDDTMWTTIAGLRRVPSEEAAGSLLPCDGSLRLTRRLAAK